MLTAQDGVHHRISGFEAGADDYLGKPLALAELMARGRVLERRAVAQRPVAEGIPLDPAAHAVVRGDAGRPGAAPAPRLHRHPDYTGDPSPPEGHERADPPEDPRPGGSALLPSSSPRRAAHLACAAV